ncbi:HAD-IA family hydrolase [Danxiaibacter flavus]|uniref:phosphoglycolate phosphatase n=1 Tax=Danxiaibacter flavus TaxID=3049108 RepID=A0ABV3Z9W3_9BACT|nr:HAD-IA family hydrolase [Chitinophagaceae bacterium DXS]
MVRNILFDFDGVLVESVQVKAEAFRQLYKEYGEEIASKVVEHHLQNGGVSRFEKIKYWHKEYLGIDLTPQQVNELADKYSDLVLQGVLDAKEVSGASDFLKAYASYFHCWIVTGTPTSEIRDILEQKKWNKYFLEAYGSPEKKTFWTQKIIKDNALDQHETVFVGDAMADYEAASNAGIPFILRKTDENAPLFNNYKGCTINDITELEKVLNRF